MARVAIFDIDGTLALRGDHEGVRGWYDWHRVGEDQPNPAVIELAQVVARSGQLDIVVVSGRDAVCRLQTEMWLDAAGVPFDELHMRRHRDNRKDSVVKAEIYREEIAPRHEVAFVVDDRRQVVDMWRQEFGLTVFQCADKED